MPWVKLDDGFWSHPKSNHISNDAFALYVCGLSYVGHYLTDGLLSDADVERIAAFRRTGSAAVDELVSERLWQRTSHGYQIHDWDKFRALVSREETHPIRREWEARGGKIRRRILERDHYACVVCGSTTYPEVDHIVAIVRGGSNAESNLQTLCRKHNRSKGAK